MPLSFRVGFVAICCVQVPFDVVMDTVLLPIDLTYHEPQNPKASRPSK